MPNKSLQKAKSMHNSKWHLSDTGFAFGNSRPKGGARPPAVAGAAPLMSPRESDIVFKMPFLNYASIAFRDNFTRKLPFRALGTIAPFGYLRHSFGNSRRALITSVTSLLIFSIFSATFYALPTHAAITLTVSTNNQPFDLMPGKFSESSPIIASVSMTNAGGYSLSLTGPEEGKLAKNGNDKANGLSSITSNNLASTAFTDNEWGYKYCRKENPADTCITTASYNSVLNTNGQVEVKEIDNTTVANATTVEYALAVGAKAGADLNAGDTYSGNIIIQATATTIDYNISFIDLTSMPAPVVGTTDGITTTVAIPSQSPVKEGYTFKGWCKTPTTNETCNGTTTPDYMPGATYNLDNDGPVRNLYAMWEVIVTFAQAFSDAGKTQQDGYYKMQDMTSSICSAVSAGQQATLIDTRDTRTYMVGRMDDGKCWMLDNLAFNGKNNKGTGSYIEMNSSNTDLPTGTTKTWTSTVDWQSQSNTYTAPLISSKALTPTVLPTSGDTNGGLAAADTVNWKYGAYYNYCATTVEQSGMCTDSNSNNATQSICPKGWHLPTGGSSGEFQALYNTSGYNSYALYRTKLRLPLSGGVVNGSIYDRGSDGNFWSATLSSNPYMHRLNLNTSSVRPAGSYGRNYGFTIRCVYR